MCLICGNPSANHTGQLPRRHFLGLLGAGLAATAFAPILRAAAKGPPPKPQNVLTPAEAFARLVEGNRRYVAGTTRRTDFATERAALVHGQNPYAGILSCADSRVGPEFAFDASRGDLFIVRVAGNFLESDGLASLEYTTAVLGTPLLVVLGHDKCGAVHAAIEVVEDGAKLPGHLPELVHHLKPAVKAAEHKSGDLLANAIEANVALTVEKLKNSGPIISRLVEEKKVRVVGGIYRLATGQVDFLF
ncbi:MAG: carbonic anhydrase [Terrimicrobiaceae bacterium]|nr:carbonic anhydrase [Terrimicrobiaceae bacterium]